MTFTNSCEDVTKYNCGYSLSDLCLCKMGQFLKLLDEGKYSLLRSLWVNMASLRVDYCIPGVLLVTLHVSFYLPLEKQLRGRSYKLHFIASILSFSEVQSFR